MKFFLLGLSCGIAEQSACQPANIRGLITTYKPRHSGHGS